MEFSIFFAGTGGSIPTARRGLPSILVRRGGDRILVDCGEGTQRQLVKSVGLAPLTEGLLTHLPCELRAGPGGARARCRARARRLPDRRRTYVTSRSRARIRALRGRTARRVRQGGSFAPGPS